MLVSTEMAIYNLFQMPGYVSLWVAQDGQMRNLLLHLVFSL